MIELRSDPKKMPIKVASFELATAYKQKCLDYGREIYITGDIPETFDIDLYTMHYNKLNGGDVDLIILVNDFANLEQKEDYGVLFAPILAENQILVDQYRNGNEKALNAIMGKFLKANKGYLPAEVKAALIEILK